MVSGFTTFPVHLIPRLLAFNPFVIQTYPMSGSFDGTKRFYLVADLNATVNNGPLLNLNFNYLPTFVLGPIQKLTVPDF